jgi:pimeloyl-ACP methyl ester carboxylesterase
MKTISSIAFLVFLSSISVVAQTKSITEEKFITIGGIEQWITIKGNDMTNPVILFLHGGPGSVMTPYAHAVYGDWEQDFILVNWDQRGAGRTYGRNIPSDANEEYWIDNPLTVERMTADGIELTEYLLKHLGKRKIILLGTSWGSILGAKMALKRPDLFYAYLGHAQIVNFIENLKCAYQKVYEMAVEANDKETVDKLLLLGSPPYDNAKDSGQLLRIIKNYERAHSVPAPDTWWKPAPVYDSEEDSKHRYDGDDYSFIHLVGHEKLGIESMASGIDFNEDGFSFKIPVYIIQGEKDILAGKEMTKSYFDKIKAPEKEYFLLADAAHGFNESVVDKQYQILKENLSLIKE